MFTKYRLDFGINKQNVDSRTSTYFSTKGAYWSENGSLKSEYGSSYSAYIYDENCNLYANVEKYNNYLRDGLGVSSSKARFITLEELISLGCSTSARNCSNAPDFVNSTYYWTGTVNGEAVYGTWGLYTPGVVHGIRPVITISKSEIEFN